jgi:hypothetical protein
VIGDREPLSWILTESMMAFPEGRSREVEAISIGDRLFLYTTRGCFHNPTRDRGKVIGEAVVTSAVSTLPEPIQFVDRSFPLGCALDIGGLAPRGNGVDVGAIVERLHLFGDGKSWGMRLRRVTVPIDKHDAGVLHGLLGPVMRAPSEARPSYLVPPRSPSK